MKAVPCITSLIGLLAVGCNSHAPDDLSDASPPKTEFVGKADEQFVSTWKSTDGVSTYKFEKDGSYKLDSKIKVQQHAPIDSHQEGQWLVNGDRMLFKDAAGSVVPYSIALKGDTLELSLTGAMKAKTVLKRQ